MTLKIKKINTICRDNLIYNQRYKILTKRLLKFKNHKNKICINSKWQNNVLKRLFLKNRRNICYKNRLTNTYPFNNINDYLLNNNENKKIDSFEKLQKIILPSHEQIEQVFPNKKDKLFTRFKPITIGINKKNLKQRENQQQSQEIKQNICINYENLTIGWKLSNSWEKGNNLFKNKCYQITSLESFKTIEIANKTILDYMRLLYNQKRFYFNYLFCKRKKVIFYPLKFISILENNFKFMKKNEKKCIDYMLLLESSKSLSNSIELNYKLDEKTKELIEQVENDDRQIINIRCASVDLTTFGDTSTHDNI